MIQSRPDVLARLSMQRIVGFLLGCFWMFAAARKITNFDNVVSFVDSTGISQFSGKYVFSVGLISSEVLIGVAILLSPFQKLGLCGSVLISVAFGFFNILRHFMGLTVSCPCIGADISVPPIFMFLFNSFTLVVSLWALNRIPGNSK